MGSFTLGSLASAGVVLIGLITCANGFPGKQFRYRALPSVSDDHYSELLEDGTYKYAYTGENRYHAERRLPDGTVEGETVHVRPDGVPVKVHYFADSRGYRPKTEVLYSERIRARVLVAEPHLDAPREVVIAPPPPNAIVPVPVPVAVPVPVKISHPDDATINARVEGNTINIGSLRTNEDVAIANPSVTAIVGPGGRAELRPESYARSGRNGIAIANPSSTAIVGPGGSVVLAPSARASTGSDYENPIVVPVPVETGPARGLYAPPIHHAPVPIEPVPVPAHTYSVPVPVHPAPVPVPVRSPDVLIVPSRPSYSYTYSYNSPDSKHPHRDSSAFVNVNVNSK